jgi:23S rRNA (adenine2503-C2)-methyltransferase
VDSERTVLVGNTKEELQQLLSSRSDAKLRSKQLAWHLYRRAEELVANMGDLPQEMRDYLDREFRVHPLHVATHKKSTDHVDKLLVHNGDHKVYECVLLPYKDRVSCCLSSQVGCPMGCTFCATGLGGFDRNLTAGEIVGQYLMLQRLSEKRISHVVFMGMGEPLLNLKNVVKAMRVMHDEIGLSYRHLTVSTVGLVPQIYQLAEEELPIHLALSLHSPFDEVRDALMPVNHKWPVREVVQAMRDYQRSTGRKVTFEYLLIKGVNDTPEQAKALVPLLKGMPNVINLIPFNWVDTERGFARPEKDRIRTFRGILENAGMNVTERTERGHDIAAACGQLAGEHANSPQRKFAGRKLSEPLPVVS